MQNAGWTMNIYNAGQSIQYMPDVSKLPLVGTAYMTNINIPNGWESFSFLSLVPNTPGNYFAATFTGSLSVVKGGTYTFCTSSDDGSTLSMDGSVVLDNGGLHGWQTQCGTVSLSPGPHSAYIDFFQNEGDAGIQATWSGPDTDGATVLI